MSTTYCGRTDTTGSNSELFRKATFQLGNEFLQCLDSCFTMKGTMNIITTIHLAIKSTSQGDVVAFVTFTTHRVMSNTRILIKICGTSHFILRCLVSFCYHIEEKVKNGRVTLIYNYVSFLYRYKGKKLVTLLTSLYYFLFN